MKHGMMVLIFAGLASGAAALLVAGPGEEPTAEETRAVCGGRCAGPSEKKSDGGGCCCRGKQCAQAATEGCCQQAAGQSQDGPKCANGQCQRSSGAAATDESAVEPPTGRNGPPFGRGRGRGRGLRRGMRHGPGGGPAGDDRFAEDHNVFFYLLDHRDAINREVTNLPDGITTVTESDDAEVAAKIREHVAAMYDRLEDGNPIHARDPLFREVFAHADEIDMEMEDTEDGIRVTETSKNPYVVKLLQKHAETVNLFIKRGRPELHRNHAPPQQEASEAVDAGCVKCQLRSFVEFDRVYIPALALTKQEQAEPARAAMQQLLEGWTRLHPILEESRSEWSADLSKVDAAIESADHLVADGKPAAAHEELETIRDVFMALRDRAGLEYALDPLNRFHAVMEQIVKPATLMEAAAVNDAYRDQLAQLVTDAETHWLSVTEDQLAVEQFELDSTAEARLQNLIAAETKSLDRLTNALSGDDAAGLLDAARSLKPGFAKVFMFFGRFPGPQHDNDGQ